VFSPWIGNRLCVTEDPLRIGRMPAVPLPLIGLRNMPYGPAQWIGMAPLR